MRKIRYPRALMTFEELREMGFPRHDLEKYSKDEYFPAHRTAGGRKWLVHTDDLDEFIEDFNLRKAAEREMLRAANEARKKARQKVREA